jgi:N-acetylneuraminate synthase
VQYEKKATKDLIVSSNEIWQMRGGIKEPAKRTSNQILLLQQYVRLSIKKGEPFTMDNIWAKRPGTCFSRTI